MMRVKILTLGLILLTIVSCKNPHSVDPSEVLNLPVINHFTATPEQIFFGESSTLSWSVSNASKVEIDQGIGEVSAIGTMEVSPKERTMYTLTAKLSDSQKTAFCVVEVKEPAADLEIILVEQGTAWNIFIYCPASGHTNPSDWQMFMYMKIKNIGNRTAINIVLHLQIFDRWWEDSGATLIWEGMTLFTNYDNSLITLGPNGQSYGWFRWTDLNLETLETLYYFLTSYSGSEPRHYWLTWEQNP